MQLGDAGLSITKIYTVSFVGRARLYLRIVEEFGSEARRFPRIAMRYGVKSNNFSTKKNTEGKTGSRLPVRPCLGKIDSYAFSIGVSFDIALLTISPRLFFSSQETMGEISCFLVLYSFRFRRLTATVQQFSFPTCLIIFSS